MVQIILTNVAICWVRFGSSVTWFGSNIFCECLALVGNFFPEFSFQEGDSGNGVLV